MKRSLKFAIILAAFSLLCGAPFRVTFAQQTSAAGGAGKPADVDRIIRAFTSKETEFRQALNNYVFKRDAVIQSIGMGGQITGEYHRVSYFTFDDKGNRFEKISFFPMPTLTELSVTEEDLEDLGGIQPFALEASKINQYNFTYVGKERIDELNLYVFDVAPKVLPDPRRSKERFFQGRIWVDDRDLQIVKVRGKGVPEGKQQRYPIFDTYREQIDGRYWFPTYTYADQDLVFENGVVSHVRMLIRYTDFKRAQADVKIVDIDDQPMDQKQQPKPTPPPVKPKP